MYTDAQKRSHISVSYTHLDVYKRQAFISTASNQLTQHALCRGRTHGNNNDLAAGSVLQLQSSLYSVQVVDVYKRQRIKKVIEELTAKKDTILFIDEMHMLMGAGAAEGCLLYTSCSGYASRKPNSSNLVLNTVFSAPSMPQGKKRTPCEHKLARH